MLRSSLFVTVLLLCVAHVALAQHGWVRERPTAPVPPTAWSPFTSAAVLNDSTILLSAMDSTIYRSVDTGRTLTAITVSYGWTPVKLVALSPTTCLAFGRLGKEFRSTDDGRTWEALPGFRWPSVDYVSFSDSLRGIFSFGDSLALTTDGGVTWRHRELRYTPEVLLARSASEYYYGIAQGLLFHSIDSGASWTQLSKSFGMESLLFLSDSIVFGAGWSGTSGIIRRSTDGGVSWQTVFDDSLPGTLLQVVRASDSILVASGTEGKLHYSTDLGQSWRKHETYSYDQLNDLAFSDHGVGFCFDSYGGTLTSIDSGRSWSMFDRFSTDDKQSISFCDSLHGALVRARGGIYLTDDGGHVWKFSHFSFPGVDFQVQRITPRVLVSIGFHSLIRSTDAGATWTQIPGTDQFEQLTFQNGVLVAVTPQAVWTSIDSGGHFTRHPFPSTVSQAAFATRLDGVCTAGLDSFYVTHDGGTSWTVVPKLVIRVAQEGTNVLALSDSSFLVLTSQGLAKSVDRGRSWTIISLLSPGYMSFADARNGLIVGSYQFRRTTDGGHTWKTQQWGSPGTRFNAAFLLDSLRGYAIGAHGVLLHTRNGGFLPSLELSADTIVWNRLPVNKLADTVIRVSNPSSDTLFLRQNWIGNGDISLQFSDSVLMPQSYVWDTVRFMPRDTGSFVRHFTIAHDSLWEDTVVVRGNAVKATKFVEPIPRASSLTVTCFPNPGSSEFTFSLTSPTELQVALKVEDLEGRPVASIFEGHLDAGTRSFVWSAAHTPSGTYWLIAKERRGVAIQRFEVLH